MHPHEITLRAPASPRTADYLRFSQTAAASHLKALGLEGKLEQQGYVWVIVRIHGRIYKPLPPTFTVRTWPGAKCPGGPRSSRGGAPRKSAERKAKSEMKKSRLTERSP